MAKRVKKTGKPRKPTLRGSKLAIDIAAHIMSPSSAGRHPRVLRIALMIGKFGEKQLCGRNRQNVVDCIDEVLAWHG